MFYVLIIVIYHHIPSDRCLLAVSSTRRRKIWQLASLLFKNMKGPFYWRIGYCCLSFAAVNHSKPRYCLLCSSLVSKQEWARTNRTTSLFRTWCSIWTKRKGWTRVPKTQRCTRVSGWYYFITKWNVDCSRRRKLWFLLKSLWRKKKKRSKKR